MAVGWEGIWGLLGVLCLLTAMQLGGSMHGGVPIEDSLFALRQIASHPNILPLMLGNATSIVSELAAAAAPAAHSPPPIAHRPSPTDPPTLPPTPPQAFFNFFGMSITKSSSAAYRMVLDSLRTIAVWLVDLGFGGGHFHPLQLLGFSFM